VGLYSLRKGKRGGRVEVAWTLLPPGICDVGDGQILIVRWWCLIMTHNSPIGVYGCDHCGEAGRNTCVWLVRQTSSQNSQQLLKGES